MRERLVALRPDVGAAAVRTPPLLVLECHRVRPSISFNRLRPSAVAQLAGQSRSSRQGFLQFDEHGRLPRRMEARSANRPAEPRIPAPPPWAERAAALRAGERTLAENGWNKRSALPGACALAIPTLEPSQAS